MRRWQIGVIGSMADLAYDASLERIAANIGLQIALKECSLVFGAERDSDSLPTIAARACRNAGGTTVGVTYEKGLDIYDPESATVTIASGLVRGGGREMVQALSCDGIIAISGGSGTLNEITVAYQAGIPVVVMGNTGGWAEELAGRFLDNRRRYAFASAKMPEDAVVQILRMVQSKQENNYDTINTTL